MVNKLMELMKEQETHLSQLLVLLQVQKEMIMKKDAFGLEGLVDKISECSKIIAKKEVDRRRLLGDNSLINIVSTSNNSELKNIYKKIRVTLNNVIEQKDTNNILLKQELIFTNKMLNVINPDREIKTYNSLGGLRK